MPLELGLFQSMEKNDDLILMGQDIATIYVVWFNTKTLKVIKSVRRQVTPKGFGFRNYWAGAIFYTIKNMKKVLKKQHKE